MFEAPTAILPFEAVQSPGLRAGRDVGPAFELKFHLPAARAEALEAWARQRLTPDPHGDDGAYRVSTVYCDTPNFDVFHRSPGFRRNKYRLRRYGLADMLYLERKSRRGDRVRKRRCEILPDELAYLSSPDAPMEWAGSWYLRKLQKFNLQPTCQVAYWRTAFFGIAGDTPVRMTFDRQLIGVSMNDWEVPPLDDGTPLLPGDVLLELKFHLHMPGLFQELLPQLPVLQPRVSKYRRCVELNGLATQPIPAVS